MFLETARAADDPLYAAYVLVLVLGLRRGEVLGLAWDDIDWGSWDRSCDRHSEEFCEICRDTYSVVANIGWQLQRVGRRLLPA